MITFHSSRKQKPEKFKEGWAEGRGWQSDKQEARGVKGLPKIRIFHIH